MNSGRQSTRKERRASNEEVRIRAVHVRKAAARWAAHPGILSFREGRLYVVDIDGALLPPKAIASLANESAGGSRLAPSDFAGARAGTWHQKLAAAGFSIFNKVDGTLVLQGHGTPAGGKAVDVAWGMGVLDEEQGFLEGALKYRLHVARDRSKKAVAFLKARRLAANGRLACECCGFDFQLTYGDRGHGYMEAHHRIPLASRKVEHLVKASDFDLVCSNCHRMLHRMAPTADIDELRDLMAAAKRRATRRSEAIAKPVQNR